MLSTFPAVCLRASEMEMLQLLSPEPWREEGGRAFSRGWTPGEQAPCHAGQHPADT